MINEKKTGREKSHVKFVLNGEPAEVAFAPHKTLLEVLREDLGLTGTKHGCELGECGTCTVLVNGRSILSCLMLGLDAEGQEVKTIEGMADGAQLHPLQNTFADTGAAQCGYCSPGFLLVAEELLKRNPNPSRAEIKEALSGNLCRCTGYIKIYEAVELAAAHMRGEEMELPRSAQTATAHESSSCGSAGSTLPLSLVLSSMPAPLNPSCPEASTAAVTIC